MKFDETTGVQQVSVVATVGGGGGGGAITAADGAIVTIGAQADAAAGADAGTFSLMAAIKRLLASITTLNTNTIASAVAKPSTSGGMLIAKMVAAATTNATLVKASPCQIYGIQGANSTASTLYVKIFNKATAPVVGTDVPVSIISVPAGARVEINRPLGAALTLGFGYAITTGYADTDTGAVTAGSFIGSVDYF